MVGEIDSTYFNNNDYRHYDYRQGAGNSDSTYMNSAFSTYRRAKAQKSEYDERNEYIARWLHNIGDFSATEQAAENAGSATGSSTSNSNAKLDIKTTDDLNERLKEEFCQYIDNKAKEEQKEQAGSFGGAAATAAGSAIIGIPLLQPGLAKPMIQNSEVKQVTEMFYKDASKKATNDLFKKYPDLMSEAQNNMNKLNKRFAKMLKKSPANALSLSNSLNDLNKIMSDAIKSGNPDKIAQANKKIEAALSANGNWFKRTFGKKTAKKQADAMKKAANKINVSSVKASCGKELSKALGHTVKGAGGMAIFCTLIDVVPKLCKGEKVNWKETLTKAGLTSLAFSAAETGAKFVVKKSLGKIAGRIAGKLAGKCAGKAIGAAIGSVVPGIGTAIGFVIGCIADWAIGKWVIPAIFPPDTSEQQAEIKKMDTQELLENTIALEMSGGKVGDAGKELMEKNTEWTNAIKANFEVQLKQQEEAAA